MLDLMDMLDREVGKERLVLEAQGQKASREILAGMEDQDSLAGMVIKGNQELLEQWVW